MPACPIPRLLPRLWPLAVVLAGLALWQGLGSGTLWGRHILSTPPQILGDLWQARPLYLLHGAATLRAAAAGFAMGCGTAFLAALAFCRWPLLERALRGINIAIYTIPAIVVGPLLVLFLRGDAPQAVLAALMSYFPAMSVMLMGLRRVDPGLRALVAVYGGGEAALLRHVRLRGALPEILAALRLAAPLSVLGAVLGEFGSGARFGFGAFLLSTLAQANPARLWGIALATSAIAGAGYLLFRGPGRDRLAAPLGAALPEGAPVGGSRLLWAVVAMALPGLLWALATRLSALPALIAPPPAEVLAYLVTPEARPLWQALAQTLPLAGLGLLAGMALAMGLAALGVLAPRLARGLMGAALVVQNTPLIAMVPFVVLVFGRGTAASVVLAMLVVFFPAYVVLARGMAAVPQAARDLLAVYGGSRWQLLWRLALPWSLGHAFTALRMVAPMALLGVMVAQWLVTGTGLGNLLNVARARMDYHAIWGGALLSVLIAGLAYEGVGLLERRWRR
ncbi:ABC transporter permease subunit [Pseudooceanicola sp. CBS1P-1]|uniref:ABC transporter permease subunit n=1 Tax=Pseudooceanicola albus TaxID=2692189 RepID=A0A6L7G660_9RHOB|nr:MULTISPECIES: ABC transporter permease subunit [Pseudooceanicola]MBT9385974.1 ABC transporter permease subunit [Pseudooceanicola endophyticus]MXN19605.1 ABC transporter permease subunit [Pseudooceanicola albus]